MANPKEQFKNPASTSVVTETSSGRNQEITILDEGSTSQETTTPEGNAIFRIFKFVLWLVHMLVKLTLYHKIL